MAQAIFWGLMTGGTIGLTALFYPAVFKHSGSGRDSMLAAAMAGSLCAIPVALVTSAVVNALIIALS